MPQRQMEASVTKGKQGTRIRSFLAVEVAPAVREGLVAMKRELAAAAADVRWVRDQALHVTIKFLGSVDEESLAEIHGVLAAALRSFPTFAVEVRGLGIFPNLRRPRVVWAGTPAVELARLSSAVDAALKPLGVARESRPFQGHITLGRVRSARGWARLEEALKVHWNDDFGVCQASELTAYRSDLRPDGAVYTKLWTAPFEAA
jgi:2'-5' RNA ligase